MKNRIYYILLSLMVSFSFMNTVFAEGLDFSITGKVVGDSTSVAKGSEATINLALTSEESIKSCIFELTQDSGIELVLKSGMNNYIVGTDGNRVLINRSSTDVDFVSGQNVLELKYKINNDGNVTIKTVECKSTDDVTGTYNDITFDFDAVVDVNDTTLSNLKVTGGVLSPNFSSSINQYVINLDSSEFSLEMTANNSDYQDDIVVTDSDGNKLDPNKIVFSDPSGQASMEVTITVNNDTKYTLLVNYKQAGLSNDLTSLKVDGEYVTLEPGKYDYTVIIDNDKTSVTIEAVLKDSANFQFAEGNGSTIFQTPNPSNTYPILILPKDMSLGAESVVYSVVVAKECEGGCCNGKCDVPTDEPDEPDSDENVTTNPSTGGVSMFIMAFILIMSLFGSIVLYQKNLKGYNK